MKLFSAIAALTLVAVSTPAHAETWKIRLSGAGYVFYSGGSNTYAVVKTRAENSLYIYHTTLKSNYWTGAGKWHDHKVIASRACPVVGGEWASTENCVVGEGGTIVFPEGTNPLDYTIEIKWRENGAKLQTSFQLN